MATKVERATERSEARANLLELLMPGDTVYTICNHVSRSGMSRSIDLLIGRDRDVLNITYWVSRAMGDDKKPERIDQTHGGIIVGGCGMDMGFALVYNLSRTLWPNGFDCTGPGDGNGFARTGTHRSFSVVCPSNDHHNPPYPARDGSMHHKDGGYALNHRWL